MIAQHKTKNINEACGQSFMFFVQANAARKPFDSKATCGGCGSRWATRAYNVGNACHAA